MTTRAATRRASLLGILSVTALGGAVAALAMPAADAAPDPCAASEIAKTIGSVGTSTGDYLDAHPDTNQALTTIAQQQAGPQSIDSLKSYFGANPKAANDLQTIAQPLTGLSMRCKLPITIPQALGLIGAAQNGGLPGGLPGGGAQPGAGAQGIAPVANAPAPLSAPTGSLPGPLPGPAPTTSR